MDLFCLLFKRVIFKESLYKSELSSSPPALGLHMMASLKLDFRAVVVVAESGLLTIQRFRFLLLFSFYSKGERINYKTLSNSSHSKLWSQD